MIKKIFLSFGVVFFALILCAILLPAGLPVWIVNSFMILTMIFVVSELIFSAFHKRVHQ